jgi:hypothetical protein
VKKKVRGDGDLIHRFPSEKEIKDALRLARKSSRLAFELFEAKEK